jgi:sugar lactone lactonase YvrE
LLRPSLRHARLAGAALLVVAASLVPTQAVAAKRPATIPLPNGFQPEGIASGGGNSLFVGSIPTGAIWAGNARTGQGAIRVPAHAGRSAIGIKVDKRGRIFVAGGETGQAYVYDAKTGADRASYQLAPAGQQTFVNDVALTRRGAYFTDSRIQQLYVVPRHRKALADQDEVRTVPLTGDIQYEAGNNANGIVGTRKGKRLIVVQGNVGKLFRVNPKTGRTREIDLGGANVLNGDGLLLRGRKLFVVQNRLHRIAVIRLDKKLRNGRVTRLIINPAFDVPTTLAATKRKRLYTVNARFTTPPTAETRYDVVRVKARKKK